MEKGKAVGGDTLYKKQLNKGRTAMACCVETTKIQKSKEKREKKGCDFLEWTSDFRENHPISHFPSITAP